MDHRGRLYPAVTCGVRGSAGAGFETGTWGRCNCFKSRNTRARSARSRRKMACSSIQQPQRSTTETAIAAKPCPVIFTMGIGCLLIQPSSSNRPARMTALISQHFSIDSSRRVCPVCHMRDGSATSQGDPLIAAQHLRRIGRSRPQRRSRRRKHGDGQHCRGSQNQGLRIVRADAEEQRSE